MNQLTLPETGHTQFDTCGIITKTGFEDTKCGEIIVGKGFVSIRGKNYLLSVSKAIVYECENDSGLRWLIVLVQDLDK